MQVLDKVRASVFEPRPAVVTDSQLTKFVSYCEYQIGVSLADSAALQKYSVDNFREFWKHFLHWSKIDYEGQIDPICTDDRCEAAVFFPDLRLNYAANLLRISSDDDGERPAVTVCHASGAVETLSRGALRSQVATLVAYLHQLGVSSGDRMAAVANNNQGAVIGALASAAVGASFSSASPDMGVPAILNRFQQISPTVLIANTTVPSQAGHVAQPDKIADIVRSLPSLRALILLDDGPRPSQDGIVTSRLSDILARSDVTNGNAFEWQRFPFNHPLFIMFSSGTTGKPKCIVHGAGGTLLEHVKEHRLHGDLRVGDKLFFHTSTAWMMWNWQLSALACGAEIVLFDGAVTGPETLWRIVSEQQVTVFGTSPPFLRLCADF